MTMPTPLGGFVTWSSWVRNTLIWLGCADPCDTMERVYEGDPTREMHMAMLNAWKDAFGIDTEFRAQQLIDHAGEYNRQRASECSADGRQGARLERHHQREAARAVAGKGRRQDLREAVHQAIQSVGRIHALETRGGEMRFGGSVALEGRFHLLGKIPEILPFLI